MAKEEEAEEEKGERFGLGLLYCYGLNNLSSTSPNHTATSPFWKS